MIVFSRKLKNFLHTLALFLCMGAIFSLVGFILAGVEGILWATFLGILILAISPNIPPPLIFSIYEGELLSANNAPDLYQITRELAARADLPAPPALYYLPSQLMNAFSVGTSENSAIGLSDALLNILSIRELIAVLAHEISHIQHNDVRVMTYADIINRITNTLSLTGFFLFFINLPLYFLGLVTISWFALGALIMAPTLMSFLQLNLWLMYRFDRTVWREKCYQVRQNGRRRLSRLAQSGKLGAMYTKSCPWFLRKKSLKETWWDGLNCV